MSFTCDFCEKKNTEVEILVASGKDDHICNECIELCVEIIAEERAKKEASTK